MSLSRLIRIAVGVPIILGISASLAWEIAKLSPDERADLYATAWDVFFTGDMRTVRVSR